MPNSHYLIIGAGISGLSNAYHLFKRFPNCSIQILEQLDKTGGAITTSTTQNSICEEGPRSLRNSKYCFELFKMIDDIGLYNEIQPAKLLPYVFIFHDGQLRRIPQSLNLKTARGFYTDHPKIVPNIMKFVASNYIANNKYSGFKLKRDVLQQDISIDQYFDRIGNSSHIKDKFVETIFYGIYGTNLNNISTQLGYYKKHIDSVFYKDGLSFDESRKQTIYSDAFNQSFKDREIENCKSFRFTNGLQQLTDRINDYLVEKMGENYSIQYNTTVQRLEQDKQVVIVNGQSYDYDHLLLNLPVKSIQSIFKNSLAKESPINKLLGNLKTTGLKSQNVCFEGEIIPEEYRGVGYLLNPKQNQNLLGVLFDSVSYPQLYPKNSTAVSFMTQRDNTSSIDENINEMSKHLKIDKRAPLFSKETMWYDTIPLYEAGHMDRSLELIDLVNDYSDGRIHIGGNCLFTPAIPELVLQSKWLVNKII